MTRWIQRVTRDRGKEMIVQYETPKFRDQGLFQRSIEDLMVVPAESMEFLLQNGTYDLQKNRFEDGWPTRLGWWPIYHRRSSGKRVNYVKLDNIVVQRAMQVRTIEGLRLTKVRRSGKEYEASERTSDEEGGGVKGGSRAHIAKQQVRLDSANRQQAAPTSQQEAGHRKQQHRKPQRPQSQI